MTFHVDISLVGICDTDQLWLPVDEYSILDRKYVICLHNYFCKKRPYPIKKNSHNCDSFIRLFILDATVSQFFWAMLMAPTSHTTRFSII